MATKQFKMKVSRWGNRDAIETENFLALLIVSLINRELNQRRFYVTNSSIFSFRRVLCRNVHNGLSKKPKQRASPSVVRTKNMPTKRAFNFRLTAMTQQRLCFYKSAKQTTAIQSKRDKSRGGFNLPPSKTLCILPVSCVE